MDPKLYNAAMNGDLAYLQTLQQTTSDLHSHRTPSQDTILHIAAQFHQTEFARAVVRDCLPLLWQVNSSGDTALHIAAAENHTDMVKFFIDCARRADIETGESRHLRELARRLNVEKDTALHCAARSVSYRSVKLLAVADPQVCSFVNNGDESPLYLCVALGDWDMHEIIINCAPSSASYKRPNGLTALHPALLFKNFPLEKIELLVRWRREMMRKGDNLGLTPLHYAALFGITEVTKLLLHYDSSAIYLLNNNGESALHFAAFFGHINVLEELINCRPDCYNMIDDKVRTALHAAVLGKRRAAVEFILATPRLARLINKPDKDGNTPLHLTAVFKLYSMIEILAKSKKVSLKIANKGFLTPLEVYIKHDEEGLRAARVRFNLKSSKTAMTMQQFANTKLERMNRVLGM